MKCCSSLRDVIFLRITSLSRMPAREILAGRCVQGRMQLQVHEGAGSTQPASNLPPSHHSHPALLGVCRTRGTSPVPICIFLPNYSSPGGMRCKPRCSTSSEPQPSRARGLATCP